MFEFIKMSGQHHYTIKLEKSSRQNCQAYEAKNRR